MAEITVSPAAPRTAATRAAPPHPSSGHSVRGRPDRVRHSVRRVNPSAVATTASLGRNSRIWAVRVSMFWPATKEYTSYRWWLRRTTSRVLVPMEPADPRTAIILIGASVILPRGCGEPAVTKCTVFHRTKQGGWCNMLHYWDEMGLLGGFVSWKVL